MLESASFPNLWHPSEIDGDFWRVHLLFGDYLRTHPKEAVDYEHETGLHGP